ncbi:response regulator [Skermanella stibiiresistens]|uniref:response regulator n=1 Tax=Skermanella stibiiresistens TaxID=913326 RepID=UPI0004B2EA7A|nr:response regulator [Skermanella stibiiresistens]
MPTSSQPSPPDNQRAGLRKTARRILVVEDETLVAMDLEDMLLSAGCEVIGPVAKVARGLALARSEPLDGAILDINVAGELVYPIAEVLSGRGIALVFASGYDRGLSVPAHLADYPRIRKPYTIQDIERSLAGFAGTS